MRLSILGINFEPERTGVARYTTALARHLSARHDVTVITGVPHYPDWKVPDAYRHWRTDTRQGRLRIIRLLHFVPRKPNIVGRAAYEFSFALRAAAVGARVPADAVIAVVPPLLGAYAARVSAGCQHAPYGVIVQDVMGVAAAQAGLRGGRSISGLTTSLERSALRAADSITTIHPRLAAEIGRLVGTDELPTVIYNWTHVADGHRTSVEARRRFGWKSDQVIAMHSGNMGLKQNLEVVIDAARLAASSAPFVHFVLAGEGSQRPNLERYAGGCPNISLVSGVVDSEYVDLLTSADVLLVNERPGMRDMSLPSKLTSYFYSARPVVAATDTGSATGEFVAASGGGVLSPAGDAQALLESVVRVARDQGLSDRLAARGRRFALQHLTESQALTAYDAWVDNLAARRRATTRTPRHATHIH